MAQHSSNTCKALTDKATYLFLMIDFLRPAFFSEFLLISFTTLFVFFFTFASNRNDIQLVNTKGLGTINKFGDLPTH